MLVISVKSKEKDIFCEAVFNMFVRNVQVEIEIGDER